MKKPVVAIDGTAASGKSTTARLVADHFRYRYIDTGAMYRAVTLKVMRAGITPDDAASMAGIAAGLDLRLEQQDGRLRIFMEGTDVTEEIRSPAVTELVSAVSSVSGVRQAMVALQRKMARGGGVVMEGRDIGTVVLPDADIKIFMSAASGERARRRHDEMETPDAGEEVGRVEEALLKRDKWDSTRSDSPLRQAPDAYPLDTTDLTVDQQVDVVIGRIEDFLRGETVKGERT